MTERRKYLLPADDVPLEVAWWILQEGRIERMARTFDKFVEAFNKHRKLSWPFDPYGAP